MSFGYGLYTNNTERLFLPPSQATNMSPDAITGGPNLRFHLGYRFMPLLSAGVYGQVQWIGAVVPANVGGNAFSGGVGAYARFYPAALFNNTLGVRRVRFDGVADRRRIDPYVSIGFEGYQAIERTRFDMMDTRLTSTWRRTAFGVPITVGADVRLIPSLAVGLQLGITPLFGSGIDKNGIESDGRGNVVPVSSHYDSVDAENAQFFFGVSARYTLTLF